MVGAVSIAVDPAYRIRDNQFWYSKSEIERQVNGRSRIVIRIEGLGVRSLNHAAPGKDGRTTKSFTLSDAADRVWWKAHRGHIVRIELLATDGGDVPETVKTSAISTAQKTPDRPVQKGLPKSSEAKRERGPFGSVLCVGIDIAWFGGSAKNLDSQYDCLAAVHLQLQLTNNAQERAKCTFARVRLSNRDPEAKHLLASLDELLKAHTDVGRIVLAIDAPIQAAARDYLPARMALSKAGMIERRACENYLSKYRQRVDKAAAGSDGWHPNIQPGAPLAPRVICFLEGLSKLGFQLWTRRNDQAEKLVIECFPAEAIWAAKRLGYYPESMTVTQVKAYKKQDNILLPADRVRMLLHDALDAFAATAGGMQLWPKVVDAGLTWLLADTSWKASDPHFYRGGKLLDDVVDSMICLATSLSFVDGQSHTWQDPSHDDDGHIIGPGRLDGFD